MEGREGKELKMGQSPRPDFTDISSSFLKLSMIKEKALLPLALCFPGPPSSPGLLD